MNHEYANKSSISCAFHAWIIHNPEYMCVCVFVCGIAGEKGFLWHLQLFHLLYTLFYIQRQDSLPQNKLISDQPDNL